MEVTSMSDEFTPASPDNSASLDRIPLFDDSDVKFVLMDGERAVETLFVEIPSSWSLFEVNSDKSLSISRYHCSLAWREGRTISKSEAENWLSPHNI